VQQLPDNLIIEERDNYLLVEFSGVFSAEAGKQVIDQMLATCQQTGHDRIVLDCRKMTGKMSLFAKFEVAVHGRKTVGTVLKTSMIILPEMIEPDSFVLTVARNRGLNMNMFTNFDDGVRWVLETKKD
jgi:hypothetical protein